MNLRHMEVFHAIMRSGSVTGAARLLNITQPAVSAVLRHCEDQLGFKLFNRVGGRLQPTPEAEAIYPDIANIFDRVGTVSRFTQDLANGRLGSIAVAATFSIANGPLATAVAAFSKTRPEVRIAIQALPTAQVISRVAQREADLGLGFAPISDPALRSELLSTAEVACIIPREHPLAALDVIDVQDLKGHNVITYAPHTAIGMAVGRAFESAGLQLQKRIQVNYSMTAFVLAARGAGIALVDPLMFTSTHLPTLVARPLRPRIEFRTMLFHLRGRVLSKTVADFVKYLKAEAGGIQSSGQGATHPSG